MGPEVGRSLVVGRLSVVNIHTSYTDLIYSSFATLGSRNIAKEEKYKQDPRRINWYQQSENCTRSGVNVNAARLYVCMCMSQCLWCRLVWRVSVKERSQRCSTVPTVVAWFLSSRALITVMRS